MDRHNTEVEIVHNAYHHLWQQLRLRTHLRQLLHLVEQFIPIQTDKTHTKIITRII